ncbi:putative transcriptional regulator [Anaerovirgula multivorans]|uniref:Putative transcriptional regulator n=1 Tax=Anaerovirgula multivorans TaxID=312168 RepID=A0A239D7T3_9FIRM|nr:helix-turn-helix transcriptional regulator [Anaerovirgula multivorans]SNS28078.1 putative transcriptional regulator [Anaerovirgula multivorans]
MNLMRKKREELNLTQEKLAEIVGVDRSTITKIENGGRTSVKTAKKISGILGFEWTSFFEKQEKYSA